MFPKVLFWKGEGKSPRGKRANSVPYLDKAFKTDVVAVLRTVFSERELTFTFAICCRPSVCRLSVTFVCPTQTVQIFGNISTALGTLAIH